MALRVFKALEAIVDVLAQKDQLNHIIDATFLVLKDLNRLVGIQRCNRCIQRLIINCKMD